MVSFKWALFLLFSLFFSASHANTGCDFTQGNKCDFKGMKPENDNFKWQLYDPNSNDKSKMIYSDASNLNIAFMYVAAKDGYATDDFSAAAGFASGLNREQSIDHCLRLKYRMFGPRVGSLKIYYIAIYGSDNEDNHLLFEKSGNQGAGWHDVQIPVAAYSPVDFSASLVLQANGVPNWHGEIAVAQVFFEEGKCYERESVSCSFAKSCGYSHFKDNTDGPVWLITKVAPGTPKTDHTSGAKYGKFVQVRLNKKTSSSELQSPKISNSRGNQNCVSFYYYLGEGSLLQMGSIDGTPKRGKQRNREWIWSSRKTDSRNEWVFGQTTLIGNSSAIVFRAQKDTTKAVASTIVAIDDIMMTSGSCGIRGNNYFENEFGLFSSNGDFDWVVTSSHQFQGIDVNDHTRKTKRAHFALALFDDETQGNNAKLISPTFRRGEASCLNFNFHFSDKEAGKLIIHYVNDQRKGSWPVIPSVSNLEISSYGDEWNFKEIKLEEDDNFQIVFEAVAGSKGSGYIAIDDVIFSDTSCLDQDSQISWSPVLPAHVPSDIDCNFEASDLCKWKQADSSDFQLAIAIAGRQMSHWDPGRDHSGKRNGVLLFTPSQSPPIFGQGGIISPQVPGNNEGHCMLLWYYIYGRGISIQVFTTLVATSEETLLWQRTYDDGGVWELAEIAIDAPKDFQIKIKMEKLAEEGTAAVDEILYSPKRCSVKKINVVDTCDFETGKCDMQKGSGSKGSWTLFSGSLKKKGGPAGDYTYRTDKGHFLLFDQNSSDAGDIAIQETPILDVGSDPSKGGQICLRFHYLMFGPDVGTLEVTLTADKQFMYNYLWRASGNHGKDWIPAEAQVDVDQGSQVEIDFKAISGDGHDGVFGIDDITLRHGKCSTPGSCSFSNFDKCGWHQSSDGTVGGWHYYSDNNEYGLGFRPGYVTKNVTNSIMISEQFEGDQVHCIHFGFAHLAGEGILALKKVPVFNNKDEHLLWKMSLTKSNSFKKKPASVTVYSTKAYEIHILADSHTSDYSIEVNNIFVTNQPCLAEPVEAVSFDCDFTDGICFWYQDLIDDYDWVVADGDPFAYLEPAFTQSKTVGRLWSPVIPAGDRCMKFTYLQYGADVGYLKLMMEAGHRQVTYIDWRGGEAIKEWRNSIIDVSSDDNFQLVFEGMCKDGDDCDIGITNIEISSPGCVGTWKSDSENPRCTFESKSNPLCEWIVSSSKDVSAFTWRHEGGFDKTDVNAPNMDFTFGGAGHYAYVAPPLSLKKTTFQVLKTTLMSPKLQSQKDYPYCMVFAYYMKRTASGTLNVYQIASGATLDKDQKPIWRTDVSDNKWRKGFASLDKMDDFQIKFEAVATTQTSEGLAIDEIYFQRGPCKKFEDKCEFTDDLCLWSNEENGTDSFDWERHHHEQSLDEGPVADYTPPGGNGHFLIASSYFAVKDEKAKLLSTMHYPTSDSSNMCLQFFYFMSGKGSVELDVNVLRGFENSKEPETTISLWQLQTNATKRKEWLKATVKLDHFLTGKPFKLEFEVTMVDGSVAIDDVEILSKECETTPDEAFSMAIVLSEASCSFTSNDMCGWENAPTDPTAPKWEITEYPPGSYLDGRGDAKHLSVTFSQDDQDKVAILKSPTLPPTNGVECLQFWHESDSHSMGSLEVKMSFKGSKSGLRNQLGVRWWEQTSINLYNDEPFQIYFEARHPGRFLLDDITIVPGPCPKSDECSFTHDFCGYVEDDDNDYGWGFAYGTAYGLANVAGIQPLGQGHNASDKTLLKSSVYAGGGSYCFNFRYQLFEKISGKMSVYAQEVGEDLGQPLWNMPYLMTLDFKENRGVSIPVFQAKPFQMVFEHTFGVANGASPLIIDSKMQTHPCEPLGSCDFEDGMCLYLPKGWSKISLKPLSILVSASPSSYPAVDHTYGVTDGLFIGVALDGTKVAELVSPILPKTKSSCLTLAYALTGSAYLKLYKDVDDVGKTLLETLSNTTIHGQIIVWNEFEIDIDAAENFVVRIEAQSNNKDDGSHASLDDIKILSGSCAEQASTKAEKKEKLEIFKDLSCDFEDASNGLCNFKSRDEGQGSWVRTEGSLSASGLSFDHTRNDSKGSFVSMVVNSGANFAQATLKAVAEVSFTSGCISFWYHMSGSTLMVYSGGSLPLWKKTNQESVVWQHAQIDLVSDTSKTTQDTQDFDKDEEFFLLDFVGVLIPNHGHLAVDDIQVYSGECQITDFQFSAYVACCKLDTCSFEEDGECNFIETNYHSGNWVRKKAGDIMDDTSHLQFTDHTYGTTEGHFMYCCSQMMPAGTEAKLISPVYKGNPNGRCLIFWTKMTNNVGLSVQVVDKEGLISDKRYVYSKSWELKQMNIRSQTDFQVLFTAQGYSIGDRVIDDIQVTPGPCHELYSCDFTLGFCTWTHHQLRHTDWHISSGLPPAGQPVIGPKFDHTTGSAAGQYVLLQGSNHPKESSSQLDSQRVASLGSQAMCFSFWYQGAGSVSVSVEGSPDSWGPYKHDEEDWMHQMITLPFFENDGKGTQISLIGSVPKGEKKYLAVDDIELLGMPCSNVQHKNEFSCKDAAKTKIPYMKVCDFKSDCSNGNDEEECGSCDFESSFCRFVDVSDNQSWTREKADPNATSGTASGAKGYFFYFPYGQDLRGSFETSNTFAMSSPSCKLQFKLYLPQGAMLKVSIKTHMHVIAIAFLSTAADWDLTTVVIGNINVPFKLAFDGNLYPGSTTGIGIDDIEMIDCGFPSAQDTCLKDQFLCSNKVCIADYKVCDFQNDCGDFSDESDCQNYIRDDFEYSLGSWTNDQDAGEKGSWTLMSLPVGQIDHTQASLRGKVLKCEQPFSRQINEGKCSLASPMLQATDGINTKTCEIHLFYSSRGVEDNEISIHTRVQGSTTKVPHNSVKEGNWNRLRATLSVATDFQIIVTCSMKARISGMLSSNLLYIDDISLTEGCMLKNDSISLKPYAPPAATFVGTTKSPDSTNDTQGQIPVDSHKDKPDTKPDIDKKPDNDTNPDVDKKPDTDTKPKDGGDNGKKEPKDDDFDKKEPKDDDDNDKKKPIDDDGDNDKKEPKDDDDDTDKKERRGEDQSKRAPQDSTKKNKASWQIPVGISVGVVGLAVIGVLVVIYLKRTNRMFRHRNSPISYTNELYKQDEEPQELEVTNYGSHDLMPDMFANGAQSTGDNAMSLDNPSYEEFEG